MDPIPFPSSRDPKLVFVAMPTNVAGDMSDATRAFAALARDGAEIGGYRFINRRCRSYDAATARNILTAAALKTNSGKILFVDWDNSAGEKQLLRILDHDEPFVGGLYPKKDLSLTPQWCCNFIGHGCRPDKLAEAYDVGAGFLCVKLDAIEWMISENPDLAFLSEDEQTRGEKMFALWDPLVVEDDWGLTGRWTRRLTDDFAFCYRARKAGLRVWVDTHCQIGHVGTVDYLEVMALFQQALAPAEEKAPQA